MGLLNIKISVLAWCFVWVFWLTLTRNFHPTFALALIATTSLVGAFAAMSYLNYLVLVPCLWSRGLRARYVFWLVFDMAVLTAIALAVIRASYVATYGPDSDPYGIYKHYAIDLFGMVVHVLAASGVVWFVNRRKRR